MSALTSVDSHPLDTATKDPDNVVLCQLEEHCNNQPTRTRVLICTNSLTNANIYTLSADRPDSCATKVKMTDIRISHGNPHWKREFDCPAKLMSTWLKTLQFIRSAKCNEAGNIFHTAEDWLTTVNKTTHHPDELECVRNCIRRWDCCSGIFTGQIFHL